MVQIMAEFKRDDYNRIVQKLNHLTDKYTIRKAINSAADRATASGITATKKGITNEYTISSGTVAKTLKKYKYGSALGMVIGMRISDSPHPMSDFIFAPKKPNKSPITVEIKRGNKKIVRHGKYNPLFIQKMPKTGHIDVFERVGAEPLPIRAFAGPTTTGMFKANENIYKAVWDIIMEVFDKRVEHELGRLLNG